VLASEAFGGPAAEPTAHRDARSCSAVHPGRPTVTRVRPAA
jgi:hypothetical protein